MEAPSLSRLNEITWHNQERLGKAMVLQCGVGALGYNFLGHMPRNGVGTVVIIDRDNVEEHNLSRAYSRRDIGRPKALAAARWYPSRRHF